MPSTPLSPHLQQDWKTDKYKDIIGESGGIFPCFTVCLRAYSPVSLFVICSTRVCCILYKHPGRLQPAANLQEQH